LSDNVNIYYFTSNTGIEKAIFEKHHDKLKVQDELMIGRQISKIKPIKTDEILRIIEQDEYIPNFSTTYDIK
jgi:SNF2 family DNA or RNA helicase